MKSEKKPKTPLHLRLTTEDWLESFKELTRAELGVLYYICTKDPYGDRSLDIDCSELGKLLGIHRTSVSRALEELVSKEFLESKYSQITKRDSSIEHQIRNRLQSELGGQAEVITAVGRIDLLTKTEIIEIKDISAWKGALGQILSYSAFFPNHSKRIHLFGSPDLAKLVLAQSTCSEFGITVTFEEVR